MDTAISIIFLISIHQGLIWFVDEATDGEFLKLPPQTHQLGEYIYHVLTLVLVWNQFDNFHDMSWGYLVGFSLGSWIGLQFITYVLAIILGTFLKLKDKLD